MPGGGRQRWLASVLRFWTMAARWKLVACTGKAAQPHTLEAVVCLQVPKAHLDLLALVTGFGELRCTHQGARRIACVLMHVARDLSEGHVRRALGLDRTWTAVAGARAIKRRNSRQSRHVCFVPISDICSAANCAY